TGAGNLPGVLRGLSGTDMVVLSAPQPGGGGRAEPRRSPDLTMSEPLVVVGNGMAAARLVDELAKVALGRYAVAVIGAEPRLAYNRVLLSSVLAGETASH